MQCSKQEYWSGLPFPPPVHLPNPQTKPRLPELAGRFFTTEPPGKPFSLLIALLLNSGLAAHCLNTNTLETSVGRKGKVTLFRMLATGGEGGLLSKSQLPPVDQRERAFKWSFKGVHTEGGDYVYNSIGSLDKLFILKLFRRRQWHPTPVLLPGKSMNGGAWKAAVHRATKSRTRLSDFTFTFHFHALEKEMAAHSSVLAWRIPGTGHPGGLPSMGSHRVGHN